MRLLLPDERAALRYVASAVGVDPLDLAAEIERESRWRPLIKNPTSSARGLIQITDLTAREMGYSRGSIEIIERFPGVECQLRGPVLDYLEMRRPFVAGSLIDLAMAIFYPRARRWPGEREFPAGVQAANKGVITVADYLRPLVRIRTRLVQEDIVC